MKDPRKDTSLEGKIYSIKERFYKPLLALTTSSLLGIATYLPTKSYAQERTTETENFDSGAATRSSYEEHDAKWNFRNQRLEADDFGRNAGITHYLFNDQLYQYGAKNLCIEATMERTGWGSSANQLELVLCADPIQRENGTYYKFSLNAHPDGAQFIISQQSPGNSHTFVQGYDGPGGDLSRGVINRNGSNTLKVHYDRNTSGYDFFINNSLVYDDLLLPNLEGYIGVSNRDARAEDSDNFLAYFDNFIVEYDSSRGAGAGKKVKKNLLEKGGGAGLEPHIPEVFLRGDSNMDRNFNLSDVLHSLNYLFLNGVLDCPDAADTNDDGQLDISDPVLSVFALFRQEKIPPPSIGGPGMDLKKDELPECQNAFDDLVPWNTKK